MTGPTISAGGGGGHSTLLLSGIDQCNDRAFCVGGQSEFPLSLCEHRPICTIILSCAVACQDGRELGHQSVVSSPLVTPVFDFLTLTCTHWHITALNVTPLPLMADVHFL